MANNPFADPWNPNMFRTPHHIGESVPTSEGFKPAEPNFPLIARYDPRGAISIKVDSFRMEVKEYIEKTFNCTARKDGTYNDKAADGLSLNPQEKEAGFLVFDFKNRGDAKRCETELDNKRVLDRKTLRVCSLTNLGWQYFDGCAVDPKIKGRDNWTVWGRMDKKNVAFLFPYY